jgi:xanthosine utilization system XapX-like protein
MNPSEKPRMAIPPGAPLLAILGILVVAQIFTWVRLSSLNDTLRRVDAETATSHEWVQGRSGPR